MRNKILNLKQKHRTCSNSECGRTTEYPGKPLVELTQEWCFIRPSDSNFQKNQSILSFNINLSLEECEISLPSIQEEKTEQTEKSVTFPGPKKNCCVSYNTESRALLERCRNEDLPEPASLGAARTAPGNTVWAEPSIMSAAFGWKPHSPMFSFRELLQVLAFACSSVEGTERLTAVRNAQSFLLNKGLLFKERNHLR